MTCSEQLSAKISNMSFVCAVLVVYIHVGVSGEPDSLEWWLKNSVAEGISRIAVPFFFLIAGFFIAPHIGERGWWFQSLQKRVRTLLLPMVIWSVTYGTISTFLKIVSNVQAGRLVDLSAFLSWTNLLVWCGMDLTTSPSLFPMWFVRCLFLLVALTPFVNYFLQRSSVIFLLGLFIISSFLYWISIPDPIGYVLGFVLSLSGILYYSVGILLFYSRNKVDGLRWLTYKTGIPSLCIGLLLICLYLAGFVRLDLRPIFVPFVLFGVWFLIPSGKWKISRYSFLIYVLHPFWLLFLAYGSRWMVAIPATWQFVGRGLLAVVLSIVSAVVIQRVSPRGYVLLFGGR